MALLVVLLGDLKPQLTEEVFGIHTPTMVPQMETICSDMTYVHMYSCC